MSSVVASSSSVPEPGLLRQVRVTATGDEIIGKDGPTALAQTTGPGTKVDVLVTSGQACDRPRDRVPEPSSREARCWRRGGSA
jgi:hypothetical protein